MSDHEINEPQPDERENASESDDPGDGEERRDDGDRGDPRAPEPEPK